MYSNIKLITEKLINPLTKIFSEGVNWFLDILFPKYCLSCSREGFYVCPECFSKIPIQKNFYCYACSKRSPDGKICQNCKTKTNSNLTGLLVASDWNNLLIRQMIYECKYRFIKDLTKPLGEILKIFLETNKLTNPVLSEVKGWQTERLTNWETDKLILIPVPLHKKRLLWRGFNQAGLIALKINEDFKIPVLNNLIFRSRHTPPQMEIKNNLEREKNIFSAFRLNSNFDLKNNPIKNNVVILIDDICTTGSTLNECAKILKPLKPKEIWGLVIARG